PRSVRTLFFGTSEFAVPSLRVMAARTELLGAVTQPDRRAGRGQRLTPSPVKRAALELGVRVYEPLRLREFAREIAREPYDLFALASYGRILPKELLAMPRLGALNVHPSLLPKYRGATPIQAALRSGDRETGVSIMLMDAGLDTGDLVLTRRVAIAPAETYGELHDRLAVVGAELLGEALDLAACGDLPRHAQSGEPSLTRPLTKEDCAVDLTWPTERIVNAVRSLSPKPAARANVGGEDVKILAAHVGERGELVIDQLIAPNRGKMTGAQFLRGRGLA
ncbi:MAG: methionyl-tRNA formyltransferase, partial [Candidatus Eremiobacteraeota bacterium]|nr:methionyl-tRNA formyltransferase [Candidatus Eremiobacteraeota bacterium]